MNALHHVLKLKACLSYSLNQFPDQRSKDYVREENHRYENACIQCERKRRVIIVDDEPSDMDYGNILNTTLPVCMNHLQGTARNGQVAKLMKRDGDDDSLTDWLSMMIYSFFKTSDSNRHCLDCEKKIVKHWRNLHMESSHLQYIHEYIFSTHLYKGKCINPYFYNSKLKFVLKQENKRHDLQRLCEISKCKPNTMKVAISLDDNISKSLDISSSTKISLGQKFSKEIPALKVFGYINYKRRSIMYLPFKNLKCYGDFKERSNFYNVNRLPLEPSGIDELSEAHTLGVLSTITSSQRTLDTEVPLLYTSALREAFTEELGSSLHDGILSSRKTATSEEILIETEVTGIDTSLHKALGTASVDYRDMQSSLQNVQDSSPGGKASSSKEILIEPEIRRSEISLHKAQGATSVDYGDVQNPPQDFRDSSGETVSSEEMLVEPKEMLVEPKDMLINPKEAKATGSDKSLHMAHRIPGIGYGDIQIPPQDIRDSSPGKTLSSKEILIESKEMLIEPETTRSEKSVHKTHGATNVEYEDVENPPQYVRESSSDEIFSTEEVLMKTEITKSDISLHRTQGAANVDLADVRNSPKDMRDNLLGKTFSSKEILIEAEATRSDTPFHETQGAATADYGGIHNSLQDIPKSYPNIDLIDMTSSPIMKKHTSENLYKRPLSDNIERSIQDAEEILKHKPSQRATQGGFDMTPVRDNTFSVFMGTRDDSLNIIDVDFETRVEEPDMISETDKPETLSGTGFEYNTRDMKTSMILTRFSPQSVFNLRVSKSTDVPSLLESISSPSKEVGILASLQMTVDDSTPGTENYFETRASIFTSLLYAKNVVVRPTTEHVMREKVDEAAGDAHDLMLSGNKSPILSRRSSIRHDIAQLRKDIESTKSLPRSPSAPSKPSITSVAKYDIQRWDDEEGVFMAYSKSADLANDVHKLVDKDEGKVDELHERNNMNRINVSAHASKDGDLMSRRTSSYNEGDSSLRRLSPSFEFLDYAATHMKSSGQTVDVVTSAVDYSQKVTLTKWIDENESSFTSISDTSYLSRGSKVHHDPSLFHELDSINLTEQPYKYSVDKADMKGSVEETARSSVDKDQYFIKTRQTEVDSQVGEYSIPVGNGVMTTSAKIMSTGIMVTMHSVVAVAPASSANVDVMSIEQTFGKEDEKLLYHTWQEKETDSNSEEVNNTITSGQKNEVIEDIGNSEIEELLGTVEPEEVEEGKFFITLFNPTFSTQLKSID